MDELRRLQEVVDGELLTPTSPGYDRARQSASSRFDRVRPRAVVRCASVADVARTLEYAHKTDTQVVPRGGGHCFAGRSSTTGVVMDLGHLDDVGFQPDGRVRIGAGARLQHVDAELHRADRALPVGCGPTVGIAGLTLGGGLGLMGRRHGLTCDSLLGATIVLADGRVVDCNARREPELFWALRGAGGGQFGVVTSLVFTTLAEPRVTRLELRWPEAAAADVATAWQSWAPGAPDDVTIDLRVVAEPGHDLSVVASGAVLTPDAGLDQLDDLVLGVSPRPSVRHQVLTWKGLKSALARAEPPTPGEQLSRSEFFTGPIPRPVVNALVEQLTAGTIRNCRELHFTAMGGAYNRVPNDATAFAHRDTLFLLQHVSGPGDPWLDRSWALVHSFGSGGVYPNFPELALDRPLDAYHGDNASRLAAIKRHYDPERLFHFPQAI